MRKRLKHERNKRKWTQMFVATSVGVTDRAYQNYESGRRDPPLKIADKLEDLFQVPQRELLENYTPDLVREGK